MTFKKGRYNKKERYQKEDCKLLSLKNITKEYPTGDTKVQALRGISLDFRENEFVSILGPSGCGKTTMLNIIGGLDQYTSGDLIINGVSTRRYSDADWDTYRNHSIGFVFQSYNLIPHQTVLANVELALTLSGVSKRERRRRAIDALKQVGLAAQIHKKPNQMSGGQMQRVAIARALVNDPDILLADEPTGALDTQTSIQIMDILRSISQKKLIIMVTHNPELARRYSSRIIKVLDGRVVDDSRPYRAEAKSAPVAATGLSRVKKRSPLAIDAKEARRAQFGGLGGKKQSVTGKKKRSMSFFTALSLSLNNLMTKKGRTFMTAFAGSIGIIGIALILSVSSGVNAYIESVQRDTLASYPIELHAESVDLTALVNTLMNSNGDDTHDHDRNKVYESIVLAQLMNALGSTGTESNDLTAFKKHLESSEEFAKYLSAIRYQYDFNWSILVREGNEIGSDEGKVVKPDVAAWLSGMSGSTGSGSSSQSPFSSMMGTSMGGFNVWTEMLAPLDKNDSNLVSSLVREKYELIDEGGRWPEAANEVVLIVDEHNEISDLALFALGLRTEEEMNKVMLAAMKGEPVDLSNRKAWSYEEIKQMRFRLLLASECYEKNANGTYTDLSASDSGLESLYGDADRGFTLQVVGIVRPTDDATSAFMSGSIGYTSALADEAMARTQKLGMLDEQKNSPDIDIITGQPFKSDKVITEEQKRTAIHNYLASLSDAEAKKFLCRVLAPEPSEEQIAAKVAEINAYPAPVLRQLLSTALETLGQEGVTVDMVMENPQLKAMAIQAIATAMVQDELNQAAFGDKTVAEMEAMLSAAQADKLYEEDEIPHDYSKSTYRKNLSLLGDVNSDSPSAIYLFAATFEDKDEISALIDSYNGTVEESKKISYTDYVGLLMSSVTTIVNAISYVLIAFVAISLVVSSIMIGIITYISVLERTKEIGILRAIGASKKDVGRVFNAETLIVGFVAGIIGIVITLLLNQVVNVILFHFTGIAGLRAVLPVGAAVILVAISMFLTLIAGLIPSGFAAKKNPVEALRSE